MTTAVSAEAVTAGRVWSPKRWLPRDLAVLGSLTAALVLIVCVSVAVGAYPIAPGDLVAVLTDRLGIRIGDAVDATTTSVLLDIRLPRVVLGIVVGAGLGCAGAVLQGIFRNPLAEPGIVGVSSGAAVGAVLALAVGGPLASTWGVPGLAFAGGILATLLVRALSRGDGSGTDVVVIVLCGIAVNAFAGAVIGMVTFFADDTALRSITFWTLGSMASASWPVLAVIGPMATVGIVAAGRLAPTLDVLATGEREAGHVGIDVNRTRNFAIGIVALLTAAAVAAAGIVAFVGLIVPHLVRLAWGPRHRLLVPASALTGALVVVAADLVCRTAAAPAELPLGVLTALIGAPCFLFLVLKGRSARAGWS